MTGKVYFIDPNKPNVRIGGVFNSCSWENSISNYRNSAEIIIPRLRAQRNGGGINIPVTNFLRAGFGVEIKCGYNEENDSVFTGYIATVVDKGLRIEIKCEGFSYLLKDRIINKSYKNPELKEILQEVINDTAIKLHPLIPKVILSGSIVFKNKTCLQVLEYLREKCLLTVFFNHNVLYVGLKFIPQGRKIKYRFGWNVINSDSLLFTDNAITTKVVVSTRKSDGGQIVSTSGSGTVLNIKIKNIQDQAFLKQLTKDIDKAKNNSYLTGDFETFLKPYANVYDTAVIENRRFSAQNGEYLIDGVKGSCSESGGRQVIHISIKLK